MDGQIFNRVIAEMVDQNLINSEDTIALTRLVESISNPNPNLREMLLNQPDLQLSAGYFHKKILAAFKDTENKMEEIWYAVYRNLKTSSESRFSEALVTSHAKSSIDYLNLKTWSLKLKYFADQLGELRDSFVVRARMIEQISNNDRLKAKESLEDD